MPRRRLERAARPSRAAGLAVFAWLSAWCSLSSAAEPPDPSARDDAAILAYHRDGASAHDDLAAAVAQGSSHPRVLLYLALAKRDQNDLKAAITVLREALESPSDLERELRLELAVTLSFDGALLDAQTQYETVLRDAPLDRTARTGRARMLAWRGRLGEARTAFELLVEEDESDLQAWLGLAAVEAAAVRPKAARAAYVAVLARDEANTEAQRGLRKLDTTPRTQVNIFGGYANVAETHHAGIAELDATFELRSYATLIGSYASSVMRFDDPISADQFSQQHVARAGVVFNIRRRVYITPQYQALVTNEDHHHGASLGLAVVANEHLTLSAAARPGVWSDGHLDILGRVSVEGQLGRRFRPSAHLYVYQDPTRELSSQAAVGKLSVDLVRRVAVTGGGGWQFDGVHHGQIGLGQLDVLATARVGIFARYEVSTGAFTRHAAGIGLRLRW